MPIGMSRINGVRVALDPLFKKIKKKLIFNGTLRNEFLKLAEECANYEKLTLEERDDKWRTARKLFEEAIK